MSAYPLTVSKVPNDVHNDNDSMDIESDGLSINDRKYDGDDERRDIDDDERRDVDHEYETSDAYSSHVTKNYFEDVSKYDGDDEHDSEPDSKKIKKEPLQS